MSPAPKGLPDGALFATPERIASDRQARQSMRAFATINQAVAALLDGGITPNEVASGLLTSFIHFTRACNAHGPGIDGLERAKATLAAVRPFDEAEARGPGGRS